MPESPETRNDAGAALREIDRARSMVTTWIVAIAVAEAACLAAFVLLADFTNRVHVLLLLSSLLIYGTLGLGLIALGAFTRWWALKIIRAVELLRREGGGPVS